LGEATANQSLGGWAERRRRVVREWLEREGAEYIVGHRAAPRVGLSYPIDFLVIRPFPLAIKVGGVVARPFAWHRGIEMLALRIALAEDVDPQLPLVYVRDTAMDDPYIIPMPFADATLSCESLPSLAHLEASARASGTLRTILELGAPPAPTFSDEPTIASR